jgi:uncharacterized membrane protein YhaH (DUF805 family)
MLAVALLPLRRCADFRGRSTRTEVVGYWLLATVLGFVALPFGQGPAAGGVKALIFVVMLCPAPALAARRLHDQGGSGWWAALALPAIALGAWQQLRRVQDRFAAALEMPAPIEIAAGIGIAVVLLLMVLPSEPGENRFGTDPRDDPAVPYF